MKTLPENYQKNIDILKENLNRGMNPRQASEIVKAHRDKFERAGVYDKQAQEYITRMFATISEHITGITIQEA